MASLQNSFALLVDDDSDNEVPHQTQGKKSNLNTRALKNKGSFNAEQGRGRENKKRTGQREAKGKVIYTDVVRVWL